MENCLVTTVKGSADIENPQYFGKIRFEIAENALFGFNAEAVPEAYGDIVLTVTSQNNTTCGNIGTHTPVTLYSTTGAGYILVPKYSITAFYAQAGISFDFNIFKELQYNNLEMFFWGNYNSSLDKSIKFYSSDMVKYHKGIKYLQIWGSYNGSQFDIDNLLQEPLENVDISDCVVHGKLSDLGTIATLKAIQRCASNVATVSSIEEFVANKREAGVTADTITTYNIGDWSKLTFNGTVVPNGAGEQALSWTANTITFRGETINA